jgi:hypothetical protein
VTSVATITPQSIELTASTNHEQRLPPSFMSQLPAIFQPILPISVAYHNGTQASHSLRSMRKQCHSMF